MKRIDKRTLTGARRIEPRVFPCRECGAIVVSALNRQRCFGCVYLHPSDHRLTYSRLACVPIDCVDCGAPVITGNYNQTRCKNCRRLRTNARLRTPRYRKMASEALRRNPKSWARKLKEKRANYQRMVRDPVRYAKYLQWKRNWYADRQAALRKLLDDPAAVARAVLELGG